MTPDPNQHGTWGNYRRGCRCNDCRQAHAAYQRKWRQQNRTKKRAPLSHGRNGFANYGCKCTICVTAQRENGKRYTTQDQRNVDKNNRARYHRKRNAETLDKAHRLRAQWTGPELEVVARTDLTPMQKAQILGRSVSGVETMMWKLRRQEPTPNWLAGQRSRLH